MLAIYTRISQNDADSHSIENQIEMGTTYATKENLTKNQYRIYVDEGVSGTLSMEERPKFEEMLNDITDGLITQVWVSRQDRLERNPEVWFYAIKILKKYKVKLYIDEKNDFFDYDNADAMFASSIQSIINKRYVDVLASASRRQITANVKKGLVHGLPPYGYTKNENRKMIVDDEEAEIVREIYDLSLKGIGTTTIAKILNERGVETTYKKIGEGTYYHKNQFGEKTIFNKSDAKWKGNTIRSIIKNPLYKGIRLWKGEEYKVDYIIDPEKWQLVNDNLPKNKNNRGKKVYHQYLLRGILVCGKCGKNMNGKRRKNKSDNFYYCASKRVKSGGCGNRSINIDVIEDIIWSVFFREGEMLTFLKAELEKDDDGIERIENEKKLCETRIRESIKEKKRLIDLVKLGDLEGDIEIAKELKSIDLKITDENHKIADFETQISNAKESKTLLENHQKDFDKYANELSFIEKQNIIKKYINRINVSCLRRTQIEGYLYKIDIKFKFKKDIEVFSYLSKTKNLFSLSNFSYVKSKFLGTSEKVFSETEMSELIKNGASKWINDLSKEN